MAFICQTRMVANAWLRPGNTAASSSCVSFMQETFEECLRSQRKILKIVHKSYDLSYFYKIKVILKLLFGKCPGKIFYRLIVDLKILWNKLSSS